MLVQRISGGNEILKTFWFFGPPYYCETQRFTDQKLSSPIFPCWLFVCLSVRPSGSVTSPLISTVWCFRPYKPYMMHVWWCLVVSGPCLVVSGARLVMLMDIDWYDLIWCIWADIFSNAYNRCTDAANAVDALMLLMRWCCWCTDATDQMMLLLLIKCKFVYEPILMGISAIAASGHQQHQRISSFSASAASAQQQHQCTSSISASGKPLHKKSTVQTVFVRKGGGLKTQSKWNVGVLQWI